MQVWDDVFYNVLRVSPECHPVFLTETALNPRKCREQMTEVMFEGFRTPAMWVLYQVYNSVVHCVLCISFVFYRSSPEHLDSKHHTAQNLPVAMGTRNHQSRPKQGHFKIISLQVRGHTGSDGSLLHRQDDRDCSRYWRWSHPQYSHLPRSVRVLHIRDP